ncbi:hypothetical protein [Nocardioides sp. NPDC006273]|uniref:hypothetical protein n=1 Tax=Nocardioides sp. NPDC006273 TaxID=3155598 RepID=UPI0033A339C3
MSVWTESVKSGWANLVGPEATRTNTTIALGSAVVGMVGAAMWAKRSGAGAASTTTMAALALDLIGGAYVNNTRASVRWYERAGQDDADHLRFAALHGHPVAVAWADHRVGARDNVASWALAQYGYMMLSTAVIRRSPIHRRSLGLALTAGGLVLDRALGSSTVAPWFAWSYYPKLLMGHAAGSLWPETDIGVRSSRR